MRPSQNRQLAAIEAADLRQAYCRWAPVYGSGFGRLVDAGVAVPHSGASLRVTGIDLSPVRPFGFFTLLEFRKAG